MSSVCTMRLYKYGLEILSLWQILNFLVWKRHGSIVKSLTFDLEIILSNIHCNIKLFTKKCAKTKISQNVIDYTFLKSPYHGEFKCAKIFAKFSLKASMQKSLQNFFAKIVFSAFFVQGLPKSSKKSKSNDRK